MSLSVAAARPPSAIFREEQRFDWWIYLLLGMVVAFAWWMELGQAAAGPGRRLTDWVALGMVLAVLFLILGVLRMTTVVIPTEVRVWFGWIPTYRRSVPIALVSRVEVSQFRPWEQIGGGGIRIGPAGERYTARGGRGVRLHLLDGSTILIGSQRPEELALAVEGALRPGT